MSSSLHTLKLSDNYLNGTFDFFWLRSCTMLNTVSLSRNPNLTIDVKFHGQVPLFQLRALMLSGCDLDNTIITGPNFLNTQRHLEILDLSNNSLSGTIPDWIFTDEATLTYLNIARNSLVGSLDSMWQHKSVLSHQYIHELFQWTAANQYQLSVSETSCFRCFS
jgi:uncharacterized protein YjbI with pentapeptide repeats